MIRNLLEIEQENKILHNFPKLQKYRGDAVIQRKSRDPEDEGPR